VCAFCLQAAALSQGELNHLREHVDESSETLASLELSAATLAYSTAQMLADVQAKQAEADEAARYADMTLRAREAELVAAAEQCTALDAARRQLEQQLADAHAAAAADAGARVPAAAPRAPSHEHARVHSCAFGHD
jgi:chromosome segregation ATPase